MEEAESRPDPQKPGKPDEVAVDAAVESISAAAPAPKPEPEAPPISGAPNAPDKRRRILNPWLGSAAAILVVLACGAAVQSPFTMVTAHRVPTSDLPRLSDPAPADGTSANGGGPSHFELPPPVLPAALPGAPTTSAPATAPGTPTSSAGTRGTTATGTGGIPQTVLLAYQQAASNLARMDPGCKLPWTLLAGIGRVESEHAYGGNVTVDGTAVTPILGPRLDGGPWARIPDTDGGRYDFDTQFDRAVGPMQFIPSTWKNWGMDGNRDGQINPQNIFDATLTAGRYLCAGNRDLSTGAGLNAAILSYNNSSEYVRNVMSWMTYYATGARSVPDARQPTAKQTPTPRQTTTKPTSSKSASPAGSPTTSRTASASGSVSPSASNRASDTGESTEASTTTETASAR